MEKTTVEEKGKDTSDSAALSVKKTEETTTLYNSTPRTDRSGVQVESSFLEGRSQLPLGKDFLPPGHVLQGSSSSTATCSQIVR